MYIPLGLMIIIFIAYVLYSKHRYNRVERLVNDLMNSYDRVVLYLVSYYLRACGDDKKKRKRAIELCAKAIMDGAGETVTTRSLMSTTDILSMCRIFRRDFHMRDKLTHPDYEFKKEYDEELKSIEKAVVNDLLQWFGK